MAYKCEGLDAGAARDWHGGCDCTMEDLAARDRLIRRMAVELEVCRKALSRLGLNDTLLAQFRAPITEAEALLGPMATWSEEQ